MLKRMVVTVLLAVLITACAGDDSGSKATADSQSLTLLEDTPIDLTLVGSAQGDSPLSYIITSAPMKGVLSQNDGAHFTFTPNENINGSDSFSFKVNDGNADSNEAVVSLEISSVNDAPVVNVILPTEDLYEASEVTFAVQATDVDGDELSYQWRQVYGIAVSLSDNTNAQPRFTLTDIAKDEAVVFELTVSDQQSATQVSIELLVHKGELIADIPFTDDDYLQDFILTMAQRNQWQYIHEVKQISFNGESAESLAGLQWLTSLEHLELGERVTHSMQHITFSDLSPLSELTKLKTLDIYNNYVADISPLQGLSNLEQLNLSYNKITDLSALNELKKLKTLDISGYFIVDISPLQGLTHLEQLILIGNKITDLSALNDLEKLTSLHITSDDSLDQLSIIGQLHTLYIGNNEHLWAKLAEASSLQYLSIYRGVNLDLSYVQDLPALQTLSISKSSLMSPEPLHQVPSLTHLELNYVSLNGEKLHDLNIINQMTSLTDLILIGNDITELTPLIALKRLKEVSLRHNRSLRDFSPLENIASLEILNASRIHYPDLSSMMGLTQLKELDISGGGQKYSCDELTLLTEALSTTNIISTKQCASN